MTKVKLLNPWRRTFQWTTTLLILLLPWFRVNGQSLLRIDIPSLSFHFFGQALRIEDLYLFLLLTLLLVLTFLLATLVFGRVWCGWACPQTTLNDLAEWLARKLGLKIRNNRLEGDLWRKVAIQAGYLFLAFLVAANLLWYFIEPREFFISLQAGDLHLAAWLTLLIVFATIYIDLALIRRLMCSDFCPYGRIQTALVEPGTLTLHLPEAEAGRCIKCGACVRACPMEIDIRKGYQVECINCGCCLDACRKVMAPCQQEGLICYSFGVERKSLRAVLNPRTFLISVAIVAMSLIMVISVLNRPTATIKISRSHQVAERILDDGQLATFFNAWINNRGVTEKSYDIEAFDPENGNSLLLKGPTRQISLSGRGNRRLDFVLVSPPPVGKKMIIFKLKEQTGKPVASAEATISIMEKK